MQPFDPVVKEYDGRRKMAETLARSSGACIAAIGLLNLPRRRVVDMWIGRGESHIGVTEEAALASVSQALAVSLSLSQNDPALAGRVREMASGEDDKIVWLKASRHLIGIGARSGDLAAFVALVCDTSTLADTPERRRMIDLGLTYANELLRDRLNGEAKQGGFPPDLILRSLSFGFAVVDASGGVNYLKENSGEWLADYDELQIVNGRLTAHSPHYQGLLQGALSAAITGRKTPSVLAFETNDGPPRTVIVLPVPDERPCALLVFGENHEDTGLRDLVLQSFGLTLAERRLAMLLLAGKSLQDAADEANLTISTARSYLKRIFAKTGIHRQSQLVSLYHRMIPSVQAMLPDSDRRN